jgi:hypothetical protein
LKVRAVIAGNRKESLFVATAERERERERERAEEWVDVRSHESREGALGGVVVKTLCYKAEGRGFETQ